MRAGSCWEPSSAFHPLVAFVSKVITDPRLTLSGENTVTVSWIAKRLSMGTRGHARPFSATALSVERPNLPARRPANQSNNLIDPFREAGAASVEANRLGLILELSFTRYALFMLRFQLFVQLGHELFLAGTPGVHFSFVLFLFR